MMLLQLYIYNSVSIFLDEHDMEGVMMPMETVTLNTHPLNITSTLI
jgi:hypothetical protein